jgi:hypothetical protein
MNSAALDVEAGSANVTERVRAIRLRLPGQALCERIEMARTCYGPLYTMGLVQERVAETLPSRIGYVRLIPDDVLLKYDEAERTGLFATFWVVTPTYYRQPQVDP